MSNFQDQKFNMKFPLCNKLCFVGKVECFNTEISCIYLAQWICDNNAITYG